MMKVKHSWVGFMVKVKHSWARVHGEGETFLGEGSW